MRMSLERQRAFDRLLRRQRMGRMLKLALPFVIGIGLLAGLIWLRTHGSAAWIGLTIAAAAGLAEPAVMAIRVREQRPAATGWTERQRAASAPTGATC